ncbi:MAG: hypothetical protein GY757_43425 [bacterium]|nr:hypothetical protein [bacterium]
MEYAKKERIGKPELFSGRKKELAYFLKWIDDIKQEKSRSTALLARRKMGKTALMERLFNITFSRNDGVIPFYYEVKEKKMWVDDFCQDFFLTFIYQYIAFKSRKKEYLNPESKSDFGKALEIAKQEGLEYLCWLIEDAANAVAQERSDILWEIVREAPQSIAARQNEYILQMIDEFQFLNAKIFRDKQGKNLIDDMAAGYLSTAESKIAPLLVSGSWVGWLMNLLVMMLPARFVYKNLNNMPEDDALEMVYNYSRFFEEPVTGETACLIAGQCEGSPFYISAMMRSLFEEKDLTTIDGLTRTLEFETIDDQGVIKMTWMEYVQTAFNRVNDRNAKKIVLHLCKNNHRQLTRKEILDDLQLDMTDEELELKLEALVKADIVNRGRTYFDYRGVQDNIFEKVFRGVYEKEIRDFDVSVIKKEYSEEFKALKKKYDSLLGKHNYQKGLITEYLILEQLRLHGVEKNQVFKSITRYLPDDFNFCRYVRAWRYDSSPAYAKSFNLDIYAHAVAPGDYSVIGEVKSRDNKKFSKNEVLDFETKMNQIQKMENINRIQGFIFSSCGFTKEADEYCRIKSIACSEDERWLGENQSNRS